MPYNSEGVFVADPFLTSLGQSLAYQKSEYDKFISGPVVLAPNSVGAAMGLEDLSALSSLHIEVMGDNFLLDTMISSPKQAAFYNELKTKYPMPSGIFYTPVSCITLDKYIKDLNDDVSLLNQQSIGVPEFIRGEIPDIHLKTNIYRIYLTNLEKEFIKRDCRLEIETKREEDIAKIFALTSVKQEDQVLGKSNTKQYMLIGSAAFILLASLYLITKK